MPWKVFKRDEKWCVFKLGDDGEPEGEAVACHESEEQAQAQLGALYAAEPEGVARPEKGTVVSALAVKAVDGQERIIEGYAATWDVDDEGEVFDREAFKSGLARYLQRPVLLFQHGRNPNIGRSPIGKVLEARLDDVGLWVRAQVFKANQAADAVWNLIQQGIQHFSVGALEKAVRKLGQRIVEWPLVEISIEPMAANPYAKFRIAKELVADYAKAIGFDPIEFDAGQEAGDAQRKEPKGAEEATGIIDKGVQNQSQTTEGVPMEVEVKETAGLQELVAKAVGEALAAEKEKARQAEEAARQQQVEIDGIVAKRVEEELARKTVTRKIIFPTMVEGKAVQGVAGPFDAVDTFELALGYLVMKAAGQEVSPEYWRGLTGKAFSDLGSGKLLTKSIQGCMFHPGKDLELAGLLTKANELMGSDVQYYGDEWVPVYYSRELFPLIRNEARVLNLFRQVEVPGESLIFPLQTGAATWYKTAQADDAADLSWSDAYVTGRVARVATSNMTLTPVKLTALTAWGGELDEQSLVPMLPFLRQEFVTSGREVMDELIISGHTEAGATNISDYGNGSIAATWRLLVFNGLRYQALVADATNKRDAGTLTSDDFLATKKLMGTNGAYALDPAKLVWIIDPGIYWKLQSLGEALTLEKFGPGFTFGSGVIERVFGSPVVVSDQYKATNSSGYIHTSTGNTLGSFMCVRPDQGIVGFGRRLKIETERRAASDAYFIVAHLMLDFDVATDECVGLSYNVTV